MFIPSATPVERSAPAHEPKLHNISREKCFSSCQLQLIQYSQSMSAYTLLKRPATYTHYYMLGRWKFFDQREKLIRMRADWPLILVLGLLRIGKCKDPLILSQMKQWPAFLACNCRLWTQLDLAKGQLISKWFFGVIIFLPKTNERIRLYYYYDTSG